MGPGAINKLGAPIFETEVFRKHMFYIEGSTCDIVGTFRHPRSQWAPPHWFGVPIVTRRREIAPSSPHHVAPLVPCPTVFCVVIATCEKSKSISSHENGCTIHDI